MRNQKGGAIFAKLAGLIATAVAAGASQAGGGVKKPKKRKPQTQKRKPKRPHCRKYKKRV
jgi:hypothetical protein